MTLKKVWIVQDRDSGLFLAPLHGDVGFFKLVNEAGFFDDAESAYDSAIINLGNTGLIFSFYIEEK